MGFLTLLQWMLNLGCASILGWLLWRRRDLFTAAPTEQHILQKWKEEWALEKENQEQQIAMQVRSLRLLCEQTKKLLEEKQNSLTIFPSSQEENEIRRALQEKAEPIIPTLSEFEAQKQRLRQEAPLDLKTILNQQLC